MKYTILTAWLLFCSMLLPTLTAETLQAIPVELKWKGIEKWVADSSSVQVISFENAKYPNETRLPYYHQRISTNASAAYSAEITNPVFVPATSEEIALIQTAVPTEIEVNTQVFKTREGAYFDIYVLPFVKQGEAILKLKSFELHTSKTGSPQKAPAVTMHSYSESSVLAQGRFVKVRITDSGIYKLTYEDLVSMGVSPADVRVFGYGGGVLEQSFLLPKKDDLPEVAIWMEKGADGVFNAGDYILFYAQGVNRWSYDRNKAIFTHVSNSYSQYGYYFVTSDAGSGRKIENKPIVIPTDATINNVEEFTDYQLYEKDLVSIAQSGKNFYGEKFSDVTSYSFNFNFPNLVPAANSTVMRVDAAASALATSSFTISLNGSQSKTLTVLPLTQGNRYELAKGASAVQYFTPPTNANSLNFTMAYYKSTGTATGYLNFMEVNARRYLKMYGSAMQFQNMDYFNTNNYNKYLLSNANSNVKIWDITDPGNISSMVTENIDGKLAFVAPGKDVANYLAIDPTAASAFPKPEIVGVVPNQNLHALPPVEMVIISHPNFVQQANALAQAHREKDNMTVEVVTTEQVYNEFSSGTPDATAYRWVMKMLRDKALATNDIINGPKYLLLFGRGTYDNRKIFSNSGNNFILTYQADNSLVIVDSYLTDDYFGFLEDNEGTLIPSHSLDIGIGRLPVTTAQQASDVVNKITGYMKNENMGYWKNQLCFLADDGDAALHMTQSDTVASSVARKFPAFDVNKIYLDAFKQETSASGQSYPLARNQFHNLIRSGLFLIDYAGHAAPLGWTNENILTASDVKSLSNKNLPLFVGATCDFIQFDVQTISAGEQVVLNPMGGGIGIVSAARPVYANQNLNLNKQFCENLFRKVKKGEKWEHMRLGDVLSYAKNQLGTETNKLPYVLLGDPALKLNYPTTYQVVTSKINKNTSLVNDTLRALSVDSIRGFIADYNGNKISSFNGKVHVTVYDKIQRITTLNNDSDGTMTYNYRPNKLFAGDTNVKDGEFCISFLLPKDIKYNFGTGRINYYAQEDSTGTEAQGYFENFIIGGGSEDIIEDSIGPGIQLYLNSTNFVSGDKVNETPLVLADISDPHGINMVENGIGHDISLTIDEDLSQSYIVNNYFQAANNSFTEGSLKYKLPEMKEGKHTLAFKVWDLLNNSSKITVNFEVVKNLAPEIFSVYNYPNPVRSQTRIKVNHDRPETILYTTVEIFDLAGRSIWSFSQSNADDITWDATTNGGLKVKSGIYFYRVTVRTSKSEITSKTNKMLVVEQ